MNDEDEGLTLRVTVRRPRRGQRGTMEIEELRQLVQPRPEQEQLDLFKENDDGQG